jgi:hypothetical protein
MKRLAYGLVIAVVLAATMATLDAFVIDCEGWKWTIEYWLFC